MKKIIHILFVSIVPLILATSVYAGSKTLTFATDCSPGSMRADAEDIFLKEVELLSNGEIKIQRFWGSSLLKSKELLKGIQDGVVDMGLINPARFPKRLSNTSGIQLLAKGPVSYENKIQVLEKIHDFPLLKSQMDKFNQKTIFLYSLSYLGITFNQPVVGFEDFKDKRVRTSSRWAMNTIEELGGVAVSLPFSDVYMALQTKAIDGVLTNVDAIHRGKLYEVAPYVVVYKSIWTPVAFLLNINQKKYNSLSDNHKKILAQASVNASKKFSVAYDQWMNKLISDMEKGGAKISFGTQESANIYLDSPANMENAKTWTAELKKEGLENPAELLEKMKAVIAEGLNEEK